MARPKPIITISLHAICVKFPLLYCKSLEVFNFPKYSLSGTMYTKYIPSFIWIVPVEESLTTNIYDTIKIWLGIKLLGIMEIKFSPNMSLN